MSKQFIDGKFVESHSNETIEVLNPANNKLIGEVAKGNEQDVKDAVAGAVQAQKSWAAVNRVKRADIVLQLAAQLEQIRKKLLGSINKNRVKYILPLLEKLRILSIILNI